MRESLAGALAHLAALAAETTHALLLPLLAHTAVDVEEHGEGVLVLNAVAGEGSSLEDLGAVDKADEVGGDEGLVLDHGLDGLDRGVGLDGVRVGVDENLHRLCDCLYNFRLLKPEVGEKRGDRKKERTVESWVVTARIRSPDVNAAHRNRHYRLPISSPDSCGAFPTDTARRPNRAGALHVPLSKGADSRNYE